MVEGRGRMHSRSGSRYAVDGQGRPKYRSVRCMIYSRDAQQKLSNIELLQERAAFASRGETDRGAIVAGLDVLNSEKRNQSATRVPSDRDPCGAVAAPSIQMRVAVAQRRAQFAPRLLNNPLRKPRRGVEAAVVAVVLEAVAAAGGGGCVPNSTPG